MVVGAAVVVFAVGGNALCLIIPLLGNIEQIYFTKQHGHC